MIRRTRLFAKTASILAALSAAGPAFASGFASPSGNIACYIADDPNVAFEENPLICLIFEADWTLPNDYGGGETTCDLDSTRMVFLPPTGRPQARWACHGDVFWPYPLGQISYGSQWTVMGFACAMARDGVTCQNSLGAGFKINRAGLNALP